MCALSGLPKKKLSIYWRDYVAAPTSHKAERIPFSAIYVYPVAYSAAMDRKRVAEIRSLGKMR
jgi:hypothetical protein